MDASREQENQVKQILEAYQTALIAMEGARLMTYLLLGSSNCAEGIWFAEFLG